MQKMPSLLSPKAYPPYATDTNYRTPPAVSAEEESLRHAVLRSDFRKVESLLETFLAAKLVLGGGVLDLALRRRNEPDLVSDGGDALVNCRNTSLSSPRRSPLAHRGSEAHRTRPAHRMPLDSEASDDDAEMKEVSIKRGGLLGGVFSSRRQSGLLDVHNAERKGPREEIVVPASSLPANQRPPAILCDSEDAHPSDDDAAGLMLRPRGLVSPQLLFSSSSSIPFSKTAGGMDGTAVDDSVSMFLSLLSYPHYNTCYCGPATVAVAEDRLQCLNMILRDVRFDPNTGCPLRVAVLKHRTACFEALMRCDRVNPNRGAPLLHAVDVGNVWAVRWLCDHPATQVNRYATGTSTTPLLCAIRRYAAVCREDERSLDQQQFRSQQQLQQALDVLRCLVMCPRIDLNKGFYITPLQLAVESGLTDLTRLLLSRPNIIPNRAIGLHPAPLQIALEKEDYDALKILLADPRCYVTEEMMNSIEEQNNLSLLQLVVSHSQDLRMGTKWSLRCLAVLLLTTFLWAVNICSLALLLESAAFGKQRVAWLLLLFQSAGCCGVGYVLMRRRQPYTGIPWLVSLVPFAPLAESIAGIRIGRWLFTDVSDVVSRQRLFEVFFTVGLIRMILSVAPCALLHLVVACQLEYKALRGVSIVCLFFDALCLMCSVWVGTLRVPHVTASSSHPEPLSFKQQSNDRRHVVISSSAHDMTASQEHAIHTIAT